MHSVRYEITYLPGTNTDIVDIASLVAEELAAPEAALRLLGKVEQAISGLQTFPYAHAVYLTDVDAGHIEFRALIVDSYIILYYVELEVVTIASIIYGGRNIENILHIVTKNTKERPKDDE